MVQPVKAAPLRCPKCGGATAIKEVSVEVQGDKRKSVAAVKSWVCAGIVCGFAIVLGDVPGLSLPKSLIGPEVNIPPCSAGHKRSWRGSWAMGRLQVVCCRLIGSKRQNRSLCLYTATHTLRPVGFLAPEGYRSPVNSTKLKFLDALVSLTGIPDQSGTVGGAFVTAIASKAGLTIGQAQGVVKRLTACGFVYRAGSYSHGGRPTAAVYVAAEAIDWMRQHALDES